MQPPENTQFLNCCSLLGFGGEIRRKYSRAVDALLEVPRAVFCKAHEYLLADWLNWPLEIQQRPGTFGGSAPRPSEMRDTDYSGLPKMKITKAIELSLLLVWVTEVNFCADRILAGGFVWSWEV